ncbi:hypothetical protein [Bradyrhizobium zhanjiangense]|uniref:Uncharacterized protein n=1 Tax=Bradyrhizobium zhanjiangense TaxID=1325107 RepID=A0A4Q0Q4H3_9BRAD|nr:hypothetical protein EAS61_40685 [Bradyrhizobium zhanjiangense]
MSDDHAGLKKASTEVLAGFSGSAVMCTFSEMREYVPRRVDEDCALELRWMYDRRDFGEVRHDPAAWLGNGAADIQAHPLGRGEHRRRSATSVCHWCIGST